MQLSSTRALFNRLNRAEVQNESHGHKQLLASHDRLKRQYKLQEWVKTKCASPPPSYYYNKRPTRTVESTGVPEP
jgi:hypothetical protein